MASADTDGKNYFVIVNRGLIENPKLSLDGFRMILCHEVGHLFSGAPRRPIPVEWDGPTAPDSLSFLSSEGQSAYYATAVCFRALAKNKSANGD